MSKSWFLWSGTQPDPAYVDDPAGGRALGFDGNFRIAVAHEDFGNVDLFPGDLTGDVEMTITMRGAFDNSVGSGARTLFKHMPVYWDGAAWVPIPNVSSQSHIKWFFDYSRFKVRVDNIKGGEAFDFRWLELTPQQTDLYFDGVFREYKWWANFRNTGSSSNNHMRFWVDGNEVVISNPENYLRRPLNFAPVGAEPLIGMLLTGEFTAAGSAVGQISALRLEIKDNT